MENQIIEGVVNVSCGRNEDQIHIIADAIQKTPGQKLLDVDTSASANRTVFTFAGSPKGVLEAAYQIFQISSRLIDMRRHKGNHPRIGAVDVCPFVALENISREELIPLVDALGERVGKELNIPIYKYEYSAQNHYRSKLPQIRQGGYEGLIKKMQLPEWQPDYGPSFSKQEEQNILRTGASVLGVRDILVAFNVSLDTPSIVVAQEIAYRLRSIGWPKSKLAEGAGKHLWKFQKLRCIGWYSDDYSCAQVSCNFLDFRITAPLEVWEKIKDLCAEYGCNAIGCEVIGLIPERCLLEAGEYAIVQKGIVHDLTQQELVELGTVHFGFNKVRPFSCAKKVLEYRLKEVGGSGWVFH